MTPGTRLREDRVYNRHPRRRGAVLIVGVGAIGSWTALYLARLGVSPIYLVDYDLLEPHNLIRHVLGAESVGMSKAVALAKQLCRDFPLCNAQGVDADFLKLSRAEQFRLIKRADAVVAATDSVDCQRCINSICVLLKPAVYPGMWVQPGSRDSEAGEVLWVMSGGHTPCYMCATTWRQSSGSDVQARGGSITDIMPVAVATAEIAVALLNPEYEQAAMLDEERTLFLIHGFSPSSPNLRDAFPSPGLFQTRLVSVASSTRCSACSIEPDARVLIDDDDGPAARYRDAFEFVETVRRQESRLRNFSRLVPPPQSEFASEQLFALAPLLPVAASRLRYLAVMAVREAGERLMLADQLASVDLTVLERIERVKAVALFQIADKSLMISDKLIDKDILSLVEDVIDR